MRLKLDENLGLWVVARLRDAGHDVMSVADQRLTGATDERLFDVCRSEQRVMVTLDLDFGDPRRFDTTGTAGVVVLRVPSRPGRAHIELVVSQLVEALAGADPAGRLWIVEPGRVRQYQAPTELPDDLA